MKRVVENTIESNSLRVSLVWAIFALIIFSAYLYAYWLNKAIFDAVKTKQVIGRVAGLSLELNTLEQKYYSLKESVTIERAAFLGLTEASNTTYIPSVSDKSKMSLRDEI